MGNTCMHTYMCSMMLKLCDEDTGTRSVQGSEALVCVLM